MLDGRYRREVVGDAGEAGIQKTLDSTVVYPPDDPGTHLPVDQAIPVPNLLRVE